MKPSLSHIAEISFSHIPECVSVIRSSFSTVAEEFDFTAENAPRFTAFAMTEERLTQQFSDPNRKMYAFYQFGAILGYDSLLLQKDGCCELNNLCVLPVCRHQGVGAVLLHHALETAKRLDCQTMRLSIVEENQVLRRWYEHHGFHHVETKKFDFFPFTCGYMEKVL